ncbi:MAG: Pseudogene of autotransporter domain-containing protein [Methanobrevibacter sp. CfCl-M3]
MMINKKYVFLVGFSLLSLLLLVSATTMNNDTGDSKNMTYDGVVFNFTATPHRLNTNDSMGYTEVNITTDKDTNKSFTLSSGNGESSIDLLNNHSVSLNTTCFNVPSNGLNKSYNLTDGNGSNVSLNVEFKEDKIFNPLGDVLPSLQGQVIVTTTIQAAVDQASNGDTVIINPGLYTGTDNKNVNITNKNLTIIGNNSGGDVVIDAEGSGRIFNITNSNVNITGLKIQNTNMNFNGGAINYNTGSNGSVNGSTFTNTSSSGSGGAVYLSGGGSVNGSTFTNTSSSGVGGAVYKGSSGGSVNGSTFTNTSSGGTGGAVYLSGGGSVNGSTFTNTRSNSLGGAVYFGSVGSVSGSTFTNTISSGSGGAVYMGSSGGSVNGSTFTNTSSGGPGGAVYLSGGGSVNGSTFTNTRSNSLGGAVYFSSGGSVNGSTFTNTNSSDSGGAVYLGGVGSVNGSTFTNTSSSGSGGAVYLGGGGSVNGSTFTNTNSSDSGGAVYLGGGGSVNGSTFTNTNSSDSGGAVYLSGGGSVNGSTFTNTNSSGPGGAVYLSGGGGSVNGSTFTNTSSSGAYGGAIYFYSGGSVTGSTFTNTNSSGPGGAVFFSSDGSVSGCSIVNCTADSGGAGIHVNSGTGNVSYNRFVNNTANGVLSNVNGFSGDRDFNWWGTNNISDAGIGGTLPNNHYTIELSAGDTSTKDVNKTVNSPIPVPLGYKMVLNTTNDTGDIGNLPDFNAIIGLNNNPGLLKNIGLFRFSPFQLIPGSPVVVSAKNPWNDTINSLGNYTFNALVDNENLNISINAEKQNTNLSIVKTVNNTNPVVGDLVGYTIDVTNNGMMPVESIKVNDTLNDSLEFVNSSSENFGSDTGIFLWNIPVLNSSETTALFITCRVIEKGEINNTAKLVSSNINNTGDNSSTVTVNSYPVNLSVNKTVDHDRVHVGDTVNYIINVTNHGSLPMGNINVSDILPAGLSFISSNDPNYNSSTGVWNIGNLNGNESKVLMITVNASGEGSIVNVANLIIPGDYINTGNNDSSAALISTNDSSGGDNNISGDNNDNGGDNNGNGDGLAKAGFPIILLVLLSVLGLVYYRRK